MNERHIIGNKYKRKLSMIRIFMNAGLRSLKDRGVRITAQKTVRTLGIGRITLKKWAKVPLYPDHVLDEQRKQSFARHIKFSIITPLYNTPENFLREMIDSVIAQTYSDWELCMVDGSDENHKYVQQICLSFAQQDPRIRYRKLDHNLGIAGNSNVCIEMSVGDFVSFLDHDDVLHPAALHDVMEVIFNEDADFIYTDEVTFESPDLKDVILIHFKPDYAPDNLLANNYICHFTTIKRTLLDQCGYFREGYDGSQDHELFLRATDAARKIVHIPKELYYWRAHETSAALSQSNKSYAAGSGKKAVSDFLENKGIKASVSKAVENSTIYRVSYEIKSEPLISIIIPNYEHLDDLKQCISSILERTTYKHYEIIIVENNSTSEQIFRYYEQLQKHPDIKVIYWPEKRFNWAELNNYAVRSGAAAGEYLLLMNNDMEVITPDWIQEMLMYAQRDDVGIVGAMLYYPDDTIQHAGVILLNLSAGWHAFNGVSRGNSGYMERLCYAQNLSAVTGACMLMRKKVFEEVGEIDERFAVGNNDIDLCMKVREAGYLIVWTPYAELYHYESKSRGIPDKPEKIMQLKFEQQLFKQKWDRVTEHGDPYYNPNLSITGRFFDLNPDEYKRRKKQMKKDT